MSPYSSRTARQASNGNPQQPTTPTRCNQSYTVASVTQVGGRCQSVELDGYRFDTGPSLLLFKHVYERTFKQLGSRLQDHVDVRRVEPAAYRWDQAYTCRPCQRTCPRDQCGPLCLPQQLTANRCSSMTAGHCHTILHSSAQ